MTYHIDEDPVLRVDGLLIEEKGTANVTVVGEIGCQGCKPPEYVQASTEFEHEKRDRLLHEQPDYDGAPLDVRPMPGRRPEAKLVCNQTKHGDCAVKIARALISNQA
jgi:hypothetical protein